MAEVSSLNIRLARAENERRELKDRLKGLQVRSLLESDKLDLMAEVSSLKIRIDSVENERRELEDRLKGVQVKSSLVKQACLDGRGILVQDTASYGKNKRRELEDNSRDYR